MSADPRDVDPDGGMRMTIEAALGMANDGLNGTDPPDLALERIRRLLRSASIVWAEEHFEIEAVQR